MDGENAHGTARTGRRVDLHFSPGADGFADPDGRGLVATLLDPDARRDVDDLTHRLGLGAGGSLDFARLYQPLATTLGETARRNGTETGPLAIAHAALLAVLSRLPRAAQGWPGSGRVMIAPLPDTTDFLGATLKAEVLRHAGWQVQMCYADTPEALLSAVLDGGHDTVILAGGRFSVGPRDRHTASDLLASPCLRRRRVILGGCLAETDPDFAATHGAAACPRLFDIPRKLARLTL